MSGSDARNTLKAYEVCIPTNSTLVERVFGVTLIVTMAAFIALGWYLHSIKALPEILERRMQEIQTSFVIEEKKAPAPPKPVVKKPDAPKPAQTREPIDLTSHPILAQKFDEATVAPKSGTVTRRVYGLRRVFSVGIGSQGGAADAVIGKLGNTLNADIDTFAATKAELKGQLVSVTTVTVMPKILTTVKPEYTREMLDAKVEGVVRANLLVDADGSVKQVTILNDLGYGTGELARAAFLKCKFEPARRGSEPVAVLFTYSIRFELLQ